MGGEEEGMKRGRKVKRKGGNEKRGEEEGWEK